MTTARDALAASSLPSHEAERLLLAATGRSRHSRYSGEDLTADELDRFERLERRRLAGEPLQYLEGDVPFGPVSIHVDPRVLIPRPETEELYETAVASVRDPATIVDLCTGSGNLAIALAATFPDAVVYATDLSADALHVARENALRNEVAVRFAEGDLFDPLPGRLAGSVDLIVANPPYLTESELDDVPDDVRYEPVGALVAGPTGLEVIERIARRAPAWLAPAGVLICEVSEFHAVRAASLFADLGGGVRTDLFGKERFVVARAPVE